MFEIRNIILHEIAHALVGYAAGHGPIWKQKAIEIGCDGERCGNTSLPAKFKGECEQHNHFTNKRQTSFCNACETAIVWGRNY